MAKISPIVRVNELEYDPILFEVLKTNTPLDILFSTEGGVPRACNFILVGDPGVGKSTVALDAGSNISKNGYKVLFISAEMNRVDTKLYVDRYHKFGDLDTMFMVELLEDANPQKEFEDILNEGWDLVVGDSFVEIQDTIREVADLSTNKAERWLINIMRQHNLGRNKRKLYTSFIMIQQATKGGVFVGSNRLKHMTTGMIHANFEDLQLQDEMFLVCSKNRRGRVHKKLYYTLNTTGDVEYNLKRFKRDEKARELREKEKQKIKSEEFEFDVIFNIGDSTSPNTDEDLNDEKDSTTTTVDGSLFE
jgi:DNA repair protein RadA/Sms